MLLKKVVVWSVFGFTAGVGYALLPLPIWLPMATAMLALGCLTHRAICTLATPWPVVLAQALVLPALLFSVQQLVLGDSFAWAVGGVLLLALLFSVNAIVVAFYCLDDDILYS